MSSEPALSTPHHAGPVGRHPAWTVRRAAVSLMLAAILPFWLLAGVLAWRGAERDTGVLLDAAQAAARRGALAIDRTLAFQRAALMQLATADESDEPSPLTLVNGWSQGAVGATAPGLGQRLLVSNAGGSLLALSGSHAPAQALPTAARASLVAAALSGTPQVSSLFRLDPDGPAETLLAVQVPRAEPLALAALSGGMETWSVLLRAADPPEGWSAALMDADGQFLARLPDPGAFVGRRVRRDTQTLLFGGGSSARTGIATGPNQLGEQVQAAWHRLESAPWVLIVALPATVLTEARRSALVPVLAYGAVLGLMVLVAGTLLADRAIAQPLLRLGRDATAFGPNLAELAQAEATLTKAAAATAAREHQAEALAARLRMVLDSTTDCIIGIDATCAVRWMNARAQPILGELAESMIGQNLFDAFPGCAEGPFADAYHAAMRDGVPGHVTAWHDSFKRWISAEAYPSADGGLTIFFRDAGTQRATEDALRESEARLRAVLDHIPLGVLLAEAPSGRILFGNRRLEEVLGQSLGALGEENSEQLWDTFQPDGRRLAPTETPLGLTLATGTAASRELLYRRRDGTTTWLRASAAPITDADGRMTGAVMAVTDVAVERRAAEALRESELRFRTLAEAVPQIVWSARPDGSVDYVNPRFTEFTGRPAHEASLPGSPVLHPDDSPSVRTAWVSALAAGRAFAAEYRMRGADGSWRWFAARALPARGPEGAVRRWIGAATDVTDLIAAREALQIQVLAEANARAEAVANANLLAVSEERFRRFGSASPDVLWITEATSNRIEYVSPAFERIWGASTSVLMADPALWTRMIHPEDRQRAEQARAATPGADSTELEYRVIRGNGQERWIRDRAFPIADATGKPYARGGIARDVTEAKAAEARQRLLIGELNHRVKNTLATVHSLSLQTARGHMAAASLAPAPREAAGVAGGPLVRFVLDLQARIMALSRTHDLLTATTWQGATLRETVRSALNPWLPGRAEETSRITFGGPGAWLAPKQALGLALALHELATNAAKHGGLSVAEGRVSVRWKRRDDGAVRLCWQEIGGPAVTPPTRRGFGTRLLERGLAGELGNGATVFLDYPPTGFIARIDFMPPFDVVHDHAEQEGSAA